MASTMHYLVSFILLCGLFAGSVSSPARYSEAGAEHQNDGRDDSNVALLSVVSIATISCFVLLVFGCACCCRKGFAKFEETTTTENVVGQSYTNFNDFSPPTESTPSYPPGHEPDTVTIEPLPDLSSRLATSPGSISQSSWLKAGSDGTPAQGTETGDINLINNPRFQFPRSQLSYVEEMGSGWFGKVLQGEAHRLHAGLRKTRVVIKQLRDTVTAEEQVLFLQEVQPYREVNHPNVLLLLGQCIESMPFLLILEYAPFGDLKSYLQKHQDSVQDMAHRDVQLRMACDMVSGLMWLHQADFIHIDLAARNCLVCADTSVKIGDYGLSLEKHPEDYYITKDQRHAVPIRWLGPEVIEITDQDMVPKKVTKESNVWSFGVIMLELSTGGQKPYPNLSNEEVLTQVVMEQEIRLDKPNLDVRYASRWFEIMMFCWLESDMRPSMKEIHELLMHLRSNTDRVEMDDFQNRWDALKPSALHDSSDSSNPDDSHLSETKTDSVISGIANGFVTSSQGHIIDTTPNVNMNANASSEPVVNSGQYQSTPLGDILKSNSQVSTDTEVPSINKELDFVIQPTVADSTESSAPVSSKANISDDIDFDPFVQPSDDDTFGSFSEVVSPPVAVPTPAPTSIPEVLISSPTSPPAMDDDNLIFEEEIAPVTAREEEAVAPSAENSELIFEEEVAPVSARGVENAAPNTEADNLMFEDQIAPVEARVVETVPLSAANDNLLFEEVMAPVQAREAEVDVSSAVDTNVISDDKEVTPNWFEDTGVSATGNVETQGAMPTRTEDMADESHTDDKEEALTSLSQDANPFHGIIDMPRNTDDGKDEEEEDGEKTPSNVLEDGANAIFDFDSLAAADPRMSMEPSLPEDSNDDDGEDVPRTSTPSSRTDDLPGKAPYSDDDSSLSFTSAVSHQTKRDDDDNSTSSYNTMVTAQSDDPSFYSFSSPASSRNDSLQLSTDGSFKTLTDDSIGSDDLDDHTFVDQTPEVSDIMEDGISDLGDGDVTPTDPQKGFISLSGDVILQHDLPQDKDANQNLLSQHGTAALRDLDDLFGQSKPDEASTVQQTLQISQKSKKGGLSIKVASKKVSQTTSAKHVRQVQQSSEGIQLYKKGDDYSVVQEVKASPSGDIAQLLQQSDVSSSLSAAVKESSSKVTNDDAKKEMTLLTETDRHIGTEQSYHTVTVVKDVHSSVDKQERIIDLMLSGPPKQAEASDEQLVDLFSAPTSDQGNNNILQGPLLQPAPLQPTTSISPDSAPLIPDLMGDTILMSSGGQSSSSGDGVLIPDLLGGDTPSLNVELAGGMTSDGSLTWNLDTAMQDGGEGQSTKGQWSATSTTDFGLLPEFAPSKPEGQQLYGLETSTSGLLDLGAAVTPGGKDDADESANNED